MDDETFCSMGYGDAPFSIKVLGGSQLDPSVYQVEEIKTFSYKRADKA